MTVRQVLAILVTLAVISLGEAWWLSHARAADCASYDAELATIRADGIAPYVIPADRL
ncbi:MAG: hypothetical protein HOP95_08915 [Sphingomonas sp.]|nr:hypothetical protein [Sphingomonas sp.]